MNVKTLNPLPSCVAVRVSARTFAINWSREFLEAGKRRLMGDANPQPVPAETQAG